MERSRCCSSVSITRLTRPAILRLRHRMASLVDLALADLAVVVAATFAVGHSDLDHRDEVQRRVEFAVAATR